MPRMLLAATILFLVGMALIVAGMLGAVPVGVLQLGSVLAIVAVILRIISRAKQPPQKPEGRST